MSPDPESSWINRFRTLGAVWEAASLEAPHVQASLGGSHVDRYFNSDVVVASPALTSEIAESVLLPELEKASLSPDWILGYAPFGLFLAHAVAQLLDARCAYSDPSEDYATQFEIGRSDSVLVVADDLHSGRSATKTIHRAEQRGAQVEPLVFCLANLSGSSSLDERAIITAARMDPQRYQAKECPFCAHGSPALSPRPHWRTLMESTPSAPSRPPGWPR
jgi:orotate phosphoribosyltransferase